MNDYELKQALNVYAYKNVKDRWFQVGMNR
jgi:hypothetical protein